MKATFAIPYTPIRIISAYDPWMNKQWAYSS